MEDALEGLGVIVDSNKLFSKVEEAFTGAKGGIFISAEARSLMAQAQEEYETAVHEFKSGGNIWPHALRALQYLRQASMLEESLRKALLTGGYYSSLAVAGILLIIFLMKRQGRSHYSPALKP